MDFTSNDYLGMATFPPPSHSSAPSAASSSRPAPGSSGSRLLSGNAPLHEAFESSFGRLVSSPHNLLFNSGYVANLSVLSSLPQPGDVLLLDEQVHNSVWSGVKMCRATDIRTFRHNDAEDFRRKLGEIPPGTHVMAVVEGYYSMSGEVAPVGDLVSVANEVRSRAESDVRLVVDEAHSSGVFNGGGGVWPPPRGGDDAVLASVHAFGKAYGSFGAVACFGCEEVKDCVVNFAKPFIYTTSLPPSHVEALGGQVDGVFGKEGERRRARLFENVREYQALTGSKLPGPIQFVPMRSAEEALECQGRMRESGYDVKAVRPPTIEKSGLRVVLHSFNELEDIKGLVSAIHDGLRK